MQCTWMQAALGKLVAQPIILMSPSGLHAWWAGIRWETGTGGQDGWSAGGRLSERIGASRKQPELPLPVRHRPPPLLPPASCLLPPASCLPRIPSPAHPPFTRPAHHASIPAIHRWRHGYSANNRMRQRCWSLTGHPTRTSSPSSASGTPVSTHVRPSPFSSGHVATCPEINVRYTCDLDAKSIFGLRPGSSRWPSGQVVKEPRRPFAPWMSARLPSHPGRHLFSAVA